MRQPHRGWAAGCIKVQEPLIARFGIYVSVASCLAWGCVDGRCTTKTFVLKTLSGWWGPGTQLCLELGLVIKVDARARTCRPPTCFAVSPVRTTPLGAWAADCVRCKALTLLQRLPPASYLRSTNCAKLECSLVLSAFIPRFNEHLAGGYREFLELWVGLCAQSFTFLFKTLALHVYLRCKCSTG